MYDFGKSENKKEEFPGCSLDYFQSWPWPSPPTTTTATTAMKSRRRDNSSTAQRPHTNEWRGPGERRGKGGALINNFEDLR